MKTIETETSVGKFILQKPDAGIMMDAMEVAENKDGFSKIKLLRALLPNMVKEHPFADRKIPIKEHLNRLDLEDFEKLVKAANPLMPRELKDETVKK